MNDTTTTEDETALLTWYGTWKPVGREIDADTEGQLIGKGLVEHCNAVGYPYKRITDSGVEVLQGLGIQAPQPMPRMTADPNSYALEGGAGSCLRCGSALSRNGDTWKHYLTGDEFCYQERITPRPRTIRRPAPEIDLYSEIRHASSATTGNCHYCGLPVGPRGCEECV